MSTPALRALGLLVALCSAAQATERAAVWPARLSDPAEAERRAMRWVLTWEGGPATVAVAQADGWQVISDDARSPYTSPPLPGPVRFQLSADERPTVELTAHRVWTPGDLAGWSGPGLRSVHVTALAPSPAGLWVGTRSAGASLWQDQTWRQLDRRAGLPSEQLHDLALHGSERWFAHDGGATRLTGAGVFTHWPLPGGALRLAIDADTAWALSTTGALRLRDDGAEEAMPRQGCSALVKDEREGWLAVCDDVWRLPSGLPASSVPEGVQLRAIVPRVDGAWLATTDHGLLLRVGDEVVPHWSPPGGALHDALRLDLSLLLAAGPDGLWLIKGDDDPVRLTPSDGLPLADVSRLAPGPRISTAWVATTRGVALAQRDGTALPLPIAPLPADLPVHAVHPTEQGAAFATALGLRWLGRRPPRGWSSFVAAVGPEVRAVFTDRQRGWWALVDDQALHLDAGGEVERWPLGAAAIDGTPFADGVAIATSEGLRAWSPTAALLSPVRRLPDIRRIVSVPDGSVWILHGDALTRWSGGSTRVWDDLPHPIAMDADASGAWLLTGQGVLRVAPQHNDPKPLGGPPGPPDAIDLSVRSGVLYLLDAAGGLWRARAQDWAVTPTLGALPGAVPLGLHADPHGAWVRTDRGVFRVVDRP